jgi:hypothetical protein
VERMSWALPDWSADTSMCAEARNDGGSVG